MRTIKESYQVYTIDDHPNKEAVLDYIRANWHDLYFWGDENIDSIIAFCEKLNLSGLDYSVGTHCHSYATAKLDSDLEEMKGIRLFKYLQNNSLIPEEDCPFTGYCLDESLLQPIRAFIKSPDLSTTFQELIRDCFSSWVNDYISDLEYCYSDEALTEYSLANEYEFTENGHFYQ